MDAWRPSGLCSLPPEPPVYGPAQQLHQAGPAKYDAEPQWHLVVEDGEAHVTSTYPTAYD